MCKLCRIAVIGHKLHPSIFSSKDATDIDVPHYALMFPTVRCCSPLCKDVPQCARMLLTVQDVPQCVQVFSTMRGFSPLCPGIPHCVGMFHSERGYSHLCAGVPHCVQVFTTVQRCSSIWGGGAPYCTPVPLDHLHTEEHPHTLENTPTL